jgi:hypothetical protein
MGDGDNAQIKAQTQMMADNHYETFKQRMMTDNVFRNREMDRMTAPQRKLKFYFKKLKTPNPMSDETLLKQLAPFGDYVTSKMLRAPEPFRQTFIDEGISAPETDPTVFDSPTFNTGSVANFAALVFTHPDKEKMNEIWVKFMDKIRSRWPLKI